MKAEDRPVVNALLAVAVALLLNVPFALESPHTPNNQQPESQANSIKCEERSYWGKTLCDPVAGYTGMLALFTALLTVVSFIQIRYLIRADINARRVLIDSRRAGNRQSREAKSALDHAKTVSEVEFRPWLDIDVIPNLIEFRAENVFVNFSVKTKNVGKTIARVNTIKCRVLEPITPVTEVTRRPPNSHYPPLFGYRRALPLPAFAP